jgi:hypothetical protein
MTVSTRHLDQLNPAQRRAVEFGVASGGSNVAGPLLVMAGAGSGKTNTIAHRVALIVDHFERVSWPTSNVGRPAFGPGSVTTVDLRARMRGMWGRTGT